MAHEIAKTKDGRDAMMYVGQVPWHQLGTQLEHLATSAEAIAAAGLDFEVAKVPVWFNPINGEAPKVIPAKFATVRTDTNVALGVVGKDYTILQNRDAFNFFDSITGEGEAMFETAGALFQGQSIWMLAKLPDHIDVGDGDRIGKYLLLTNTHDGSRGVRVFFTPIRVVCNNTLNVALAGGLKQGMSIRHSPVIADRIAEAGKLMGITNRVFAQVEKIYKDMATIKMTGDELVTYVKTLFPDNAAAKTQTRSIALREEVMALVEAGDGADLDTARGTLWGAYNGVTAYVDHVRNATAKDQDARLSSVWFGSGARVKQAAFDLAVETMSKN